MCSWSVNCLRRKEETSGRLDTSKSVEKRIKWPKPEEEKEEEKARVLANKSQTCVRGGGGNEGPQHVSLFLPLTSGYIVSSNVNWKCSECDTKNAARDDNTPVTPVSEKAAFFKLKNTVTQTSAQIPLIFQKLGSEERSFVKNVLRDFLIIHAGQYVLSAVKITISNVLQFLSKTMKRISLGSALFVRAKENLAYQ
ncbi:hypothetical protein J6590_005909 [Homalodisca vitripennis]|nr:hypothetical protein J6590_005909 [Homalodisca vitripennis]